MNDRQWRLNTGAFGSALNDEEAMKYAARIKCERSVTVARRRGDGLRSDWQSVQLQSFVVDAVLVEELVDSL